MRKYLYMLAAGMLASVVSCNKEVEKAEGGPASFGIMTYSETEFVDMPKNSTKVVDIAAVTEDTGVLQQLTVSFKADKERVDDFNALGLSAEALMLPDGAYEFTKNNVTIYSYNKNSATASLKVSYTKDMLAKTNYVLPVVVDKVEGSDLAGVDSESVLYIFISTAEISKGSGTAEDPFLIYDAKDFKNMAGQVAEVESLNDAPTYFRLEEDIDMSGIDWVPFNNQEPYMKKIDLDGNGKTVNNFRCEYESYSSLCGVVFGSVYNLNFKNAYIEGENASGILGGYAGTGDKSAEIHHVNVHGQVKCENATATGIGGIVGRISNANVYACSADVEVSSPKNYVGGIAGYIDNIGTVRDCITKGKIISVGGAQRFGGVVGGMTKAGNLVENCISLTDVQAGICAGGIVGHCNLDKSSEQHPGNTVRGCIAWNENVEARSCKVAQYSSGIIVGYTALDNNLQNCYRRSDLQLFTNRESTDQENYPTNYIEVCDQQDASSSSPLSAGVDCDWKNKQIAPYHGKAAGAAETASQVAKRLGWNEEVWDLSGSVPELK